MRDDIREKKYTEYLGKKQAKIDQILTYEK